MAIKAFTAVLLGAISLSGATCGKSSEDAATPKPGPEVPLVSLDGVDISPLTQREKKEWSSYVGELLSPCPNVPVPIAQCVKEKRDCDRCVPAAKFLLKLVKDGLPREPLEKSYKNRFDADKVKTVPIDGSPTKGLESAPVTIVEFADFQCPHCAQFAPMIEKLVESRKTEVRFVYKFYVLGKFPNSENAARAAIAAGKQGKLWDMHRLIFEHQDNLTQQGLDALAGKLGLDIGRFHADMQSAETADRVAKDRKLGEDLKIEGTPTLFINGRQYDGRQEMDEWLNLELSMMGKAAPPAAKAPEASVDAGARNGADAGKAASSPPAASASAAAKH
jgi:protein-disulfide isomerase